MVTDTNALSGSFNPDNGTTVTFSPGDGELYYLGRVEATSDGSAGGSDMLEFAAHIHNEGVPKEVGDVHSVGQLQVNLSQYRSTNVGRYITEAHQLTLSDINNDAFGGNIVWSADLRRVF